MRSSKLFRISSLRRELSPFPAQSCANHVQHLERLSRAICRVPRGTKGSPAIKSDRVEIAFIWALFYWLNHQPTEDGRKPEYPEKTPDDELQKMPHNKSRKFKPQPRLEPAR